MLVEAHDEWQTTDRRYLAEATMALLNPPPPQETVATPELMTAWSEPQSLTRTELHHSGGRDQDEPPRLLVWLAKYLVSDRHRFGEDVELSTVEEAVAWLRAQSEAIVCGGADWTLASAERTLPQRADHRTGPGRHGVILCPRDLRTDHTVGARRGSLDSSSLPAHIA